MKMKSARARFRATKFSTSMMAAVIKLQRGDSGRGK
jgi:hypothetical protein